MIGILVISHGSLSQSFVESGQMIVGKQKNIDFLGLNQGDNIDDFYDLTTEKIKSLDHGKGVLVFTDLYGASPFKATAYSVAQLSGHVFKSVSGVNFPMYIESVLLRESMELEELAIHVMTIGKDGIKELFNEAKILQNKGEQ